MALRDLILASLHHLAMLLLIAALVAEWTLLRRRRTTANWRDWSAPTPATGWPRC